MIQPFEDGLKRFAEIGEVHDPTGVRIDFAAHVQLDAKRMAVQAGAFVACRHVGQPMRRLDRECAKNFHERTRATQRERCSQS